MGSLTSLATTGLNLALAEREKKREADQLERDKAADSRRIQADRIEARRKREAALNRRVASERARAGAAGVGGVGGAVDAIVMGLTQEARERDRSDQARAAQRLSAVEEAYQNRRRANLLEFNNRWLSSIDSAVGGAVSGRRNLLG